jgi:hypothetical protein
VAFGRSSRAPAEKQKVGRRAGAVREEAAPSSTGETVAGGKRVKRQQPCAPNSECEYCGAPIIWIATASGAGVKLAAKPVKDGNVILTPHPENANVLIAVALAIGDAPLEQYLRYQHHAKVCKKTPQPSRAPIVTLEEI